MDDEANEPKPKLLPALVRLQHEFSQLDRKAKYEVRKRLERRAKKALTRAGGAAPPWLTQEHHDAILSIFQHAEQEEVWSGIRQEVDHIVPLHHPDVCGLHVPWNLQILTDRWNMFKGNKFDGTWKNEGWRDALPPNGVVFEGDFPPEDEDDAIPF